VKLCRGWTAKLTNAKPSSPIDNRSLSTSNMKNVLAKGSYVADPGPSTSCQQIGHMSELAAMHGIVIRCRWTNFAYRLRSLLLNELQSKPDCLPCPSLMCFPQHLRSGPAPELNHSISPSRNVTLDPSSRLSINLLLNSH
jgi:hypothetical protein